MWTGLNKVSPELLDGCHELALPRASARAGAGHAEWLCRSSEACTAGALVRVSRRSWLPPVLLLAPAKLRRCRLPGCTCSVRMLCHRWLNRHIAGRCFAGARRRGPGRIAEGSGDNCLPPMPREHRNTHLHVTSDSADHHPLGSLNARAKVTPGARSRLPKARPLPSALQRRNGERCQDRRWLWALASASPPPWPPMETAAQTGG